MAKLTFCPDCGEDTMWVTNTLSGPEYRCVNPKCKAMAATRKEIVLKEFLAWKEKQQKNGSLNDC